MNLLEKFEKLNNRLSNLLEENKELKQQYKNLQEENEELKEKLDKNDYKSLQEKNKELKRRLEERDKQYQQHVLNLEKQRNEQLELKRQYKNLQKESNELKQKFNERERQFLNLEKQKTNSLEENKELKRQYKNLQEDNKKLKENHNDRDRQFQQHVLNLSEENKELKRQYKNLQEDNKKLKENHSERDRQFQRHVLNLTEENKELKRQYENLQGNKNGDLNLIKENKELKLQCENLQEDNKKQVLNLREENRNLKRQCKNFQEENKNFKEQLDERDKQFQQHVLNLSDENRELKHQYKNFQEEIKNLKEKLNERERQFQQHILNLSEENKKLKRQYKDIQEKFNERDYKNLQEENKNLKEKLNERDEQFQQYIINLEKTLGKLELDEVNDNDIKEKNGPLTTLIDDDDYNDGFQDIKGSSEHSWISSNKSLREARVIVGLDFGTIYSGFSYCHVDNAKEICTYDEWHEKAGNLKTNTILQYDSNLNVKQWGRPLLSRRQNLRRQNECETIPVELFKLHLTHNLEKPYLPEGLCFKKTISDYFREIGKVIKEAIERRWPDIDFFQHVLLVFTIPAELQPCAISTIRECVYDAGLIKEKYSTKLRFITEPEAAAVYCIDIMGRDDILTKGSTFMMADCGGGTVDLTTYKLLENKGFSEIIECTGDSCGSTFVDKGFINFLGKELGYNAIELFKNNNYDQFQYIIQEFCQWVKLPFTGDLSEYRPYYLDIEEIAQYVSEETKYKMEESDWIIEIKYNDVKNMFDPVIDKIISLIQHSQLQKKCSTILLVGGFSESKYLQKRIKEEFQHILKNIYIPNQPIAAISRGATLYGLNPSVICGVRILKYTYGIKVRNYWVEGDPIDRKLHDGRIDKFDCLVKCGTQIDQEITKSKSFIPLSPTQTRENLTLIFLVRATLINYYLSIHLDEWKFLSL
ncbi:unnamed protein product [Rhizophagus irregularis]|nr:unnamed protein product [Rhizophagus irregularis]